jgi:adenylate kinase family enzyme
LPWQTTQQKISELGMQTVKPIVILGNSGSGKSTLARWLAHQRDAPLLDLDTVAWEPKQIALARSPAAAQQDVRAFCSANQRWVIEGCYANLARVALEFAPTLIFLNPGVAQCIANCRMRPWEPHKYPSKAEQDERLAFLLAWVSEYYSRTGEMSLSAHAALFAEYAGEKHEFTHVPVLDALTKLWAD